MKTASSVAEFLKSRAVEYQKSNDVHRARAYFRASSNLLSELGDNYICTSDEDYRRVYGIGDSINDAIHSFLQDTRNSFQISDEFDEEDRDFFINDLKLSSDAEIRQLARVKPALFTDKQLKIMKLHRLSDWRDQIHHITQFLTDGANNAVVCGSIRRGLLAISDVDIVSSAEYDQVMARIAQYNLESTLTQILVINHGSQMVRFRVFKNGLSIKVDLRLVNPEEIPFATLYLTGPAQFNIRLRQLAASKGLKLNEYGLFNRESNEKIVSVKSEEDVFSYLGIKFIPPENRTDSVKFSEI